MKKSKLPKTTATPPSITKRDPTEEGDYSCGTFTWEADQLALICMHNSPYLYEKTEKLFQALDKHLLVLVAEGNLDLRTAGLAFLLAEGGELYEDTKQENNGNLPEDQHIAPTPDQTRDWFCWLYRHFRDWKQDQSLVHG